MLLIKIAATKFKKSRTFTITPKYSEIVKKYRDLRLKKTETDRFFVNFHGGKCTVQVIGRRRFCSMPKQIASFLKLQEPNLYTGHVFRLTAASLQKDVGSNILDLLDNNDDIIIEESQKRKITNQEKNVDLSSIKFQEILFPYQESDDDEDDYEDVPIKIPKLEMDFELKSGHDPLEKM